MLSNGSHQYWIWGSYHTSADFDSFSSASMNSYEAHLTCCMLFNVSSPRSSDSDTLGRQIRSGTSSEISMWWPGDETGHQQSCCFTASLRLTWRHRWPPFLHTLISKAVEYWWWWLIWTPCSESMGLDLMCLSVNNVLWPCAHLYGAHKWTSPWQLYYCGRPTACIVSFFIYWCQFEWPSLHEMPHWAECDLIYIKGSKS